MLFWFDARQLSAARNALWGCLIGLLLVGSALAEPARRAILITAENGKIAVEPVTGGQVELAAAQRGLIIWSEDDRDRWQFFSERWTQTAAAPGSASQFDLSRPSRGGASQATGGQHAAPATTLLAQLRPPAIPRGPGQIVTPYDRARILDARMTFRRELAEKGKPLPAFEAIVSQGESEVIRIPFPQNVTKVAWCQLRDLPDRLKEGLPAGRYQLELPTPTGPDRIQFSVDAAPRRMRMLEQATQLGSLLKSPLHPVAVQVTVETLLHQEPPYLGDALDALEQVPLAAITPRLSALKKNVIDRLKDPGQRLPLGQPADRPTGDAAIDEVRMLIDAGYWEEALEELEALDTDDSAEGRRRKGLACLYRGVVLSETGAGHDEKTAAAFREAIVLLEQPHASADDMFRARNNFANFLLDRAFDRLHNHAFQMATGVKLPLTTALLNWIEARQQYEQALRLSDEANDRASVLTNQARLNFLLADIVRTLGHPDDVEQRLPAAEQAASRQAQSLAEESVQTAGQDSLAQAVAQELLAHLAFRGGDICGSETHAERALENYVRIGSLTGVESTYRLLGLLKRSQGADGEGLAAFLVAERLADVLRGRIPADQIGLSRAGFFARRAYVSEQIVDLLVAAGKHAQALQFAEGAKASVLRDMFLAEGSQRPRADVTANIDVPSMLGNWPTEVVALEYFLGSTRAWVFLIDSAGHVRGRVLTDEAGAPLSPRELVADVAGLLDHMNLQAQKMAARRTWDHAWQAPLHKLFVQLIPAEYRAELQAAKLLVVVPHHILHYLPFAALVVEPDNQPRGRREMPRARFLIDGSFAIHYAPSLLTWQKLRGEQRPMQDVRAVGLAEFESESVLPGVRKDLENVQEVFGKQVRELVREADADEQTVLQTLRQHGMVLVATHGLNVADDPLASYIQCAPARGSDGLLTAREIYQAEVRAELVITSACYTGLADRSPLPGDDLFGLQRALLHSGAHTVVSGVWDIYDLTGPQIMRRFFEGLHVGKTASQALTDAQRDFLNEQRSEGAGNPLIHPYFFSVFTATGSDLTRFSNRSD